MAKYIRKPKLYSYRFRKSGIGIEGIGKRFNFIIKIYEKQNFPTKIKY